MVSTRRTCISDSLLLLITTCLYMVYTLEVTSEPQICETECYRIEELLVAYSTSSIVLVVLYL